MIIIEKNQKEEKEHQRKACIIKTKISLFMKSSNYLSTNRLVKVYFSNKVTFQNVLQLTPSVNKRTQDLATPIKKTSSSNDHKNLDNIIQQNNYNNVYLIIIGENLQDRRKNHSLFYLS